MATPSPSVLESPVYIQKAKGLFPPGTFVELATGIVAMILQTSGLEDSRLPPHGDLPENLRPRSVKVALLHPFAAKQVDFTIARLPCLDSDCRHVPELVTSSDETVVVGSK
jgi:hypothetical protein